MIFRARHNPVSAAAWAKRQKSLERHRTMAGPWPYDIVASTGRPARGFMHLVRSTRTSRLHNDGTYTIDREAQPVGILPSNGRELFTLDIVPKPGYQVFRLTVERTGNDSTLMVLLEEDNRGQWSQRGLAMYDAVAGDIGQFFNDGGEDPFARMPRMATVGVADALRRALGPRVFDDAPTPSRQLAIAARKIEFVMRGLGNTGRADGTDMLHFADRANLSQLADAIKGRNRDAARRDLAFAVMQTRSATGGTDGLTDAIDAFGRANNAASPAEAKKALAAVSAALAPMIEDLRVVALAAYRVEG